MEDSTGIPSVNEEPDEKESLIQRVKNNLEARRQKLLNGLVNSIPSPFTRFSDDFIGIEQSTAYLITSYTKGSKSQFTSFIFIFGALLYAYNNSDKMRIRIFYFPLEETPERITERFMSYLLFRYDGIRIAPQDLRSSKNSKPVDRQILELLDSPKYADTLKFFEERISFESDNNPTGIFYCCKRYAESHGTVHTKKAVYKNEQGKLIEVDNAFDWYEAEDKEEFRIVVIDHISLIDCERGLTQKQSMDKLSEYCTKYLRNRYGFIPVIIQQQNTDNESNDSFKLGRLRPTISGLSDSKYTGRDSNIVFGLFSPYKFGLETYMGYDIKKFKDHIRFLEVLANRDGEMGGICPLFFDGATCSFFELPKPDNTEELKQVYAYIDSLKKPKSAQINFTFTTHPTISRTTTKSTNQKTLSKLWQMFVLFWVHQEQGSPQV